LKHTPRILTTTTGRSRADRWHLYDAFNFISILCCSLFSVRQ